MYVPKNFWGDSLLLVILLFVPSSVLYGHTQFSTLYNDKKLFDLTARVFGCLCFVHILGTRHDKLDSRGKKYVFLGYSHTKKAIDVGILILKNM